MRRHSIIRPEQLAAESLVEPISPVELKITWLSQLDKVLPQLEKFPGDDLGCLYLDKDGELISEPKASDVAKYKKHFGSVFGSWPRA